MGYRTIFILCACFSGVYALPSEQPDVKSGDVTPSGFTSGSKQVTLTVGKSSPTNVLEWKDFSIESGERVVFERPGSSADYHVFNRVTGDQASQIKGYLMTQEENGHIYLINKNGIILHQNGMILAGSFLASTLDLVGEFDKDATSMRFKGNSKELIDLKGTINAMKKDITIIGYKVRNSGTLSASNTVAMGSGVDIILKPNDAQRIFIQTSGSVDSSSITGIENSGTISGESLSLIADGNPYALAINLKGGSLNSTACSNEDGQIKVIADAKTNERGAVEINAPIQRSVSTGSAPDVEVHGDSVALKSSGSILVSGSVGGGDVTIGGDSTYNTNHIYIDPSAKITASATTSGNGGDITLYADESILHRGTITAKGGATSGNGGDVTMNSPGYLGVDGTVNLSTTSGTKGIFTAQSSNILVGADANYGNNFSPTAFSLANTTSMITKGKLESILANSEVVIKADGSSGVGTVDVVKDISWSSGCALSLEGLSRIQIDKDLTMTGSDSADKTIVTLTAPVIRIGKSLQTHTSSAGIDLTSGGIKVTASDALGIYGGSADNSYAKLDTLSGDNTISFGNSLHVLAGASSGANAGIKGDTVTINSQVKGIGDIDLLAGDCSKAYIDGSTVSIGGTTLPKSIDITAGCCSSSNDAWIGNNDGGSDISIALTGDLVMNGGVSGTGNKAKIISSGGSEKEITINVKNLEMNGGALGTSNASVISSSGSSGKVSITTAQDMTVVGGGDSTTANSSYIYGDTVVFNIGRDGVLLGGSGQLGSAYIHGYKGVTGKFGRYLNVNGGTAPLAYGEIKTTNGDIHLDATTDNSALTFRGGTGALSRAQTMTGNIYVGKSTSTPPASVDFYGGNGTDAFSGLFVQNKGDIHVHGGNITYKGGGDGETYVGSQSNNGSITHTTLGTLHMETGTHKNSHALLQGKHVNVTAEKHIRMIGDCSIPNEAHMTSDQKGGTVTLHAKGDFTRRGLTYVRAIHPTGAVSTRVDGIHSVVGCNGEESSTTACPPTCPGDLYYKYHFLYELFYRLRHYTNYDWYLLHSTDFWEKATYTSP